MTLGRRDLARGGALAAALTGLSVHRAHAASSTYAGLAVSCDPELRGAITSLGRLFTTRTGFAVRVFCGAPWQMLAQIERMTQTDLLVTLAGAMDDGARRALVKPETRVSLGRNRLALAARRGTSTGADLSAIRSLIGGGPVALPDPTSITTIDSAGALSRLGFSPPYPFRVIGSADGEDVAFLVADGAARFGLLYATEIKTNPDLVSVVVLPGDAPAGYAAAVSTVSRSPNAARFLEFLHTPQAAAALRVAGLEELS